MASTATATGRSKQHTSSSSTANSKKRKSLATDPTLLQSESDEDGESDQHGGRSASITAQVRNNGKSASVTASKSVKKASTKQSSVSHEPEARRSTRLSAEGLATDTSDSRIQPPAKSKSKASQSEKTVSGKRKETQDSGIPARSAVENTHPTPPLTDPDMEEAQELQRQSQTSRQSSKSGVAAGQKVKKSKTASQPTHPNNRHASQAPHPVAVPADGSDDFTFVRMDASAAPSASAPNAAMSNYQASTSSLALPSTAPARASSANATKKSKTKTVNAHLNSQEGTSHTLIQPSAASASNAPTGQIESQDRKGKRKAVEMDTSASGNGARQASSRDKQKPEKKKGKHSQQSQQSSHAEPSQVAGIPGTPPGHTSIPMNSQETPAIRRNQAMRAGVGGPPGTPGTLARRSSGDMRGRRGSSIGNGFEALPHPSLPTNTLYRHIKADDPPAIRFRTLLTWSAHRLKEAMEAGFTGPPSAAQKASSGVVEALIRDLAEKKIDLSWQEEASAEDASLKNLPPNPENEMNKKKLEDCQAWTEQLRAEDATRNARIHQYKTLTESISKLINPIPPAPQASADGTIPVLPDVLHPNFSLPIPRMSMKGDILDYGRALLLPKAAPSSRRKSVAPSASEQDVDPDIIDVSAELPLPLDDIRHQAASMHQTAHRLEQFLKLTDTFLNQHLEKTQRDLSHLTLRSTSSSNGGRSGSSQTMGLQIAGASTTITKRKGMSLTDMLRGISRCDTAAKRK